MYKNKPYTLKICSLPKLYWWSWWTCIIYYLSEKSR